MAEQMILMGVIGRPHGVRGLCHVHAYTADPEALARFAPLLDAKGAKWTLRWEREGIARLFDEAGRPVSDRSAAERLVNTRLFAARAQLPELEADEFYLADLIGMDVRNRDGLVIGQVGSAQDHGGGTYLEIALKAGGEVLLAFNRASVPHIDLAARALTVELPHEIIVAPETAAAEAAQDAPANGERAA